MDKIFVDFLNTSITASYIIVAVLLVRVLFKKIPRKFMCALWAIAGLRLALPFSIESSFSLIPSTKTIDPVSGTNYGLRLNSGITALDVPVNNYLVENEMAATSEAITPADKNVVFSVVAIVWLVGIAAILLYGIISYFKLKKTVSTAVLLKDNIMQSESVVSPFILGIFKPKIYIPFGMDEETQNYVVAHENAHIKRRDHLIKPTGFLLLAVYWFNPLVWIAYILLCRDIERACDEKVVYHMDDNERKEYAQALLGCAVSRSRIAACPLAFGEVGIKERIKGVMNYKKPAFWVIVVAFIACIVAALCFLTNPKNEASNDYEYPYRVVANINYKNSDKEFTKVLRADSGVNQTVISGVEYTVGEVNLQTGEITLDFNGDKELISKTFGKPLEFIVLNLTESVKTETEDGTKITFSFVQTQSVDSAVSQAILEYNQGKYMQGTAAFESHEILKVERDKGFIGSDDAESVTVYLLTAYGEYICNNGKVESVGGCGTPAALSFNYINGIYTLTEYWEPEMGSRYVDSIRKKFPPIEAEIAIHGDASVVDSMDRKAEVYFESLDNGCAVNTGVDGFNANVIAMPIYGDDPYIEIEWANGTLSDIACVGIHNMQVYRDHSWVQCEQTEPILALSFLRIIKPGKVYTERYSLDMFDIEADGLYRFTDTFEINGEKITVRIDFNKGPVKGDSDDVFATEELTTTAVYIES